jgi:predicted metallopeptidase
MRYKEAPDLKLRTLEIVKTLGMGHVDTNRIECIRSMGSSTKRTIARVHTLGKLMQKAMKLDAFYAIEFLERFEKLSREDQDKVIIHELLHIPKTFGGGFRQHDFVCENNVEIMYEKYLNLKEKNSVLTDFEGNLNQKELEKPVKRRPLW